MQPAGFFGIYSLFFVSHLCQLLGVPPRPGAQPCWATAPARRVQQAIELARQATALQAQVLQLRRELDVKAEAEAQGRVELARLREVVGHAGQVLPNSRRDASDGGVACHSCISLSSAALHVVIFALL